MVFALLTHTYVVSSICKSALRLRYAPLLHMLTRLVVLRRLTVAVPPLRYFFGKKIGTPPSVFGRAAECVGIPQSDLVRLRSALAGFFGAPFYFRVCPTPLRFAVSPYRAHTYTPTARVII